MPEPGIEAIADATPAGQCKGSTPEKLFTQAGGHPNYGITDFKIDTYPTLFGIGGFPTTFLKDIVVDTPEGLSVNPEALPQCDGRDSSKTGKCPPTTLVGINYLTVAAQTPTEEQMPGPKKRRTGRRMPAGPGRAAGLQPGAVRRRAVDGRLPDRSGPDLHRRLAEPGRPARHLHDQRHQSAVGEQARRSSSRAWSSSAPKKRTCSTRPPTAPT